MWENQLPRNTDVVTQHHHAPCMIYHYLPTLILNKSITSISSLLLLQPNISSSSHYNFACIIHSSQSDDPYCSLLEEQKFEFPTDAALMQFLDKWSYCNLHSSLSPNMIRYFYSSYFTFLSSKTSVRIRRATLPFGKRFGHPENFLPNFVPMPNRR